MIKNSAFYGLQTNGGIYVSEPCFMDIENCVVDKCSEDSADLLISGDGNMMYDQEITNGYFCEYCIMYTMYNVYIL